MAGWTEIVWNTKFDDLLHMTSAGNRTLDLLVLSPTLCLLGHIFHSIVRATPLGTGFVDIFIGKVHSESDEQMQ